MEEIIRDYGSGDGEIKTENQGVEMESSRSYDSESPVISGISEISESSGIGEGEEARVTDKTLPIQSVGFDGDGSVVYPVQERSEYEVVSSVSYDNFIPQTTSSTSNLVATTPEVSNPEKPLDSCSTGSNDPSSTFTATTTSTTTPTSNSIPTDPCWICLIPPSETPHLSIVSPCKCKGTLSFVHQKCLLRYINSTYPDSVNAMPEIGLFGTRRRRRGAEEVEGEHVQGEQGDENSKEIPRCPQCKYPYRIVYEFELPRSSSSLVPTPSSLSSSSPSSTHSKQKQFFSFLFPRGFLSRFRSRLSDMTKEFKIVLFTTIGRVEYISKAAVPYILGSGAISGLWILCTVHGVWTVLVMMGDDAWNALEPRTPLPVEMGLPGGPHGNGGALGTDVSWGWRQYIGFPLIPICLVLSRTKLADDVLPYLPVVFLAGDSSGDYRGQEDLFGWLSLSEWMNEPNIPSGFLMALVPMLRHVYNGVMDRIAQLILSPSRKKKRPLPRSPSSTASATVDATTGNDDEDDEDNVVDLYQQRNKIGIGSMIAGGLLMPLFANRTATLLGRIPFVRDCLPKNTFARNLVGGALFVVAKDVLELWYTYEKGKYMQSRRVLDYAGPGS